MGCCRCCGNLLGVTRTSAEQAACLALPCAGFHDEAQLVGSTYPCQPTTVRPAARPPPSRRPARDQQRPVLADNGQQSACPPAAPRAMPASRLPGFPGSGQAADGIHRPGRVRRTARTRVSMPRSSVVPALGVRHLGSTAREQRRQIRILKQNPPTRTQSSSKRKLAGTGQPSETDCNRDHLEHWQAGCC